MKSNRHSTRSASWLTTRAEVIAQSASTDRWGGQAAAIFFPFESKPSARSLPAPLPSSPTDSLLACLVTHGYGIPVVLSNQFHTRSKVNLRNERRKVNIETSRFEIYRDGAQRTLVGTLEEGVIFRRTPTTADSRSFVRASNYTIKIFFYRLWILWIVVVIVVEFSYFSYRWVRVEERVLKNGTMPSHEEYVFDCIQDATCGIRGIKWFQFL